MSTKSWRARLYASAKTAESVASGISERTALVWWSSAASCVVNCERRRLRSVGGAVTRAHHGAVRRGRGGAEREVDDLLLLGLGLADAHLHELVAARVDERELRVGEPLPAMTSPARAALLALELRDALSFAWLRSDSTVRTRLEPDDLGAR